MPTYTLMPDRIQVTAVQVKVPVTIAFNGGFDTAFAGDWLVTYPNGKQGVAKDEDFRACFVPIDPAELIRGIRP